MAASELFDRHVDRYERWFDRHRAAFVSELLAIRALLPFRGHGLEVGVGTGRFAAILGIGDGVDPSWPMLKVASERGIRTTIGVAEALPYGDATFDEILIVTTVCFVEDPTQMMAEVVRVLRAGGGVTLGFVDRDSALGTHYLRRQDSSIFYRDARFYSAAECRNLLHAAGLVGLVEAQTLFTHPDKMVDPEPVRSGTGEGGFAVMRATKLLWTVGTDPRSALGAGMPTV